jgi:hypothetical protein
MTSTVTRTERTIEAGLQSEAARRYHEGADQMERNVNRLSGVIETLQGDLWLLIYDIPSALNDMAPNPSREFWMAGGFRLNKSCWVFSDKNLGHRFVRETLEAWSKIPQVLATTTIGGIPYSRNVGVKVHKIKFAEDQLAAIREIARETLREELIRVHTSLIERIGAADRRLQEAEDAWAARFAAGGEAVTEEEQEKANNSRRNNVRSTLRDALACFEGALASARAFDETDSLTDLFNGVRQAIRAEVLAFNARAQAEGYSPVREHLAA